MAIEGLKPGKNGTRSINKKIPTTGTPVNLVQGSVVLSMGTKPTADDTVTIGTTVYTFVATPAASGDVAIGAAVANSQANLVVAINDGDEFNTAHSLVTISDFAGGDATVTAILGGTAGNIASTETFAAEGNVFASATLLGGAGTSTKSEPGDMYIDDTNIYIMVAKTEDVLETWRKVAHSAL